MAHRIWHYDGLTAVRHTGELVARPDGFSLILDNGGSEDHPWSALQHNGSKGGDQLYNHESRSGWTIGLGEASVEALSAHLPRKVKYGAWVDRLGLGPASGIFLAVSAVVAIGLYKAPETLAPLVPLSWEVKLGDSMVDRLDDTFCTTPDGKRALTRMAERVGGKGGAVDIHVAKIDMVNAVALPGGKIVIFQGLLDAADSPQEVAGVVGHEVGHVRKRHVMESLLRQMGISVVLGGVDGDVGAYANTLISATFSRDAESEADDYAIAAMKSAQVDPGGAASFFQKLAKMEGEIGRAKGALSYISSHPMSADREKAFRASRIAGRVYPPVLSDADWQTLKAMCSKDPKAKARNGIFF